MLYRQDSPYLQWTMRGIQHPLSEQAMRLGIGIGHLNRMITRNSKRLRKDARKVDHYQFERVKDENGNDIVLHDGRHVKTKRITHYV